MKRRNFLIALGVVPTLALEACSKNSVLPNTPTIVIGKVIDENDMPVEGFKFQFGGQYTKGIATIPTFDVIGNTNNNGIYNISYTISDAQTKQVTFKPVGNETFNLNTQYDIYLYKDNQYEKVGNPISVITYGETNTFNFQIRKK